MMMFLFEFELPGFVGGSLYSKMGQKVGHPNGKNSKNSTPFPSLTQLPMFLLQKPLLFL
jgi:hypothetical protein